MSVAADSTANVNGFLSRLGHSEGADYNTIVGGGTFNDFSRHPGIVGAHTSAGPSTAAGRYQITKQTYDRVAPKLGITDFSPASQDQIAAHLIAENGAMPDVVAGNYPAAVKKLGGTWASLPSSPYDQPKRTMDEFMSFPTAALMGRAWLPGASAPGTPPEAAAGPDLNTPRDDSDLIDQHYNAMQDFLDKQKPFDASPMFAPLLQRAQDAPTVQPLGAAQGFAAAFGAPQAGTAAVNQNAHDVISSRMSKNDKLMNLHEALINANMHEAISRQDAGKALGLNRENMKLQSAIAAREEVTRHAQLKEILGIRATDAMSLAQQRAAAAMDRLNQTAHNMIARMKEMHMPTEKIAAMEQYAKAALAPLSVTNPEEYGNAEAIAQKTIDHLEKMQQDYLLSVPDPVAPAGGGETPPKAGSAPIAPKSLLRRTPAASDSTSDPGGLFN